MPTEYLPLLVFPEKRILQPERGKGFPPSEQKIPGTWRSSNPYRRANP
jgi:hypothetical protein